MRLQRELDPPIRTSYWLVFVGTALMFGGCNGPYIRSQQDVYAPSMSAPAQLHTVHEGTACGPGNSCWQACSDGQLKLGLPHPILHAIAGPFIPRALADPYQSTAHPPHSKFHPVPTRPVFSAVGPMNPLSPDGGRYMMGPSPTLAAPLPGNSEGPPQVEEVPHAIPEQMQDNEPAGSGVVPGQLPPQATADMMPTATDGTPRGERRARWGEMPSQPATRAVSAEARFVEL